MAGKRKRSDDESASTFLSSAHDLHDHFSEPPHWKYDVFLSFQGEGPNGTRNNFIDVLYTELCRKAIVTFKDDEELRKGRVIGDDLMKAIEDSALFLVVFSKDYASSKWCLNELVKIMECSRIRGASSSSSLIEAFVLPIFHDVEPKDVRKQEGSFKESFLRHEQDDTVDKAKISKWKSAMEYAGNLSGWVTHGKKWTEIVNGITQLIFNRTNHHWSSVSKDLVGLDLHLQNVMTLLSKDSTCFVGICGMGRIGKTTLADVVYRRIRHCFEASIFIPNIRQTSSKGTELVKGIVLTSPMTTFGPLSAKAFSHMVKLRLLILRDISFYGGLDYLSNDLGFLKWKGFPFEYLPTSFEAKNLVELNLPNSHIKELWCGTKYFMDLKTIKLSHSKSLSKTPDFTGTPNLEKLILEGCLQLQEVHKSIKILKKLTLLNLKDCERLKVLPDSICDLPSLRLLDLSGCLSLIALPRNLGSLKCLEELKVVGMGTKRSSASWWSRFNLFALESSRNSTGLWIPPLSGLTSLTKLDMSFCNLSDGTILDDIGRLHSLEELKLNGNLFSELSPCFTQHTKLRRVYLNHCKSLRYLPTLPSSVERAFVDDCTSLESLPNQITTHVSRGSGLSFWNCENLVRNYGSSDLAKWLLENYIGSVAHNGTHTGEGFFNILIPGNSIPTWISNQRSGGVVSIDLSDSGLQGTWSGFVGCCVFEHCTHQNSGVDCAGRKGSYTDDDSSCVLICRITKDELDYGPDVPKFGLPLFVRRLQSGSGHIWLFHVFREHYSFLKIPFDNSKQVDFLFSGWHGADCIVVKSCGAVVAFPLEQEAKPMGGCEITELD